MSILLTGGLILVAGAIAGAFAKLLRLPTLVGYLAAGVLLGHHVLDGIPHAQGDQLYKPVTDITMALVLFVLGGQFRLDAVRGKERPVLLLALAQSVVTFVLVAAAVLPWMASVAGAVLLGILAVEVAPATTVVILREYEASGPLSEAIQLVTALSDVLTIFFFEVALLVLIALSGGVAQPEQIAWDIGGSILFGLLSGYALIILQDRIGFGNYSLPLLAVLLLTIGLCQHTGVPHMLVFLVTGAVVANRSRFFEPITASMDNFAQPAYVAFFVLGGWHLDFGMLATHWRVAGVYMLARTAGKLIGARVGERVSGLHSSTRHGSSPFGLALLSQAGAALALAQLAMDYDRELGTQLLNIVLAGTVVFELVGPLLLRRVVVRAGEVRIGHLLTRSGVAPRSWRRTLARVARGPWRERPDDVSDLTVRNLMRTGVKALPARANLDEILRYANHSPFNRFPVADDDGRLAGMIRLRDLNDLVYAPDTADLVIAADILSAPARDICLESNATLQDAAAFFAQYPGNTVPVVDDSRNLKLLGILERAEILRVMRHARGSIPPPASPARRIENVFRR